MTENGLRWLDSLSPEEPFPSVDNALTEPNGLLAIGGDLSPRRLLRAYRKGIFPWYNPGEPILWWSPDPRTLFRPEAIHVSRSLHRQLRHPDCALTLDRAFDAVIELCAAPRRGQRETWLGQAMREAYCGLHELGYAHSVEVWRERSLVGGLYGLALGRGFFGESMFSRAPSGSRIALVYLARQLHEWEFLFFDGQVGSPHLYRMGAIDVPRREFSRLLQIAVRQSTVPAPWRFDIAVPDDPGHLPRHMALL